MGRIYCLLGVLFMSGILVTSRMEAQESLSIGKRYTVFSQWLNEEREYWIYQPETKSVDTLASRPVLYLLDGDSFYHSVVGFTRLFSSSKVSSLPPCTVVAVLNTDRTRDFTPTPSAAQRDGTIPVGEKPVGGGAERFYRFLTEELRTEVEKQLPGGGPQMLVGHSYAGLFTLDVLFRHPQAFDIYIAVDPSLWWDRGQLLRETELRDSVALKGKKLYAGFATQPRHGLKLAQFTLMDEFQQKLLPEMEKQGLLVKQRNFTEETHGTVALPGFYDALKQLFVR